MNKSLHPLDFTEQEFYEKLGAKKEHVNELCAEYVRTRSSEVKSKIKEIMFPVFDELVLERMKYFFDNWAEYKPE